MGINNLEQSSRTVNNHVLEHFCLSLLHFLGAAPRSCRGVSPLFSILLSTLLHRSPLFSILLFISPIFHFYSLQCSISVLHFPYYSFSPLFSISLSKLLHLSPLFSILLSQYVPSCFAILLYITISQFSILFSTILHITLYIVQLNPLNSSHSTLLHISTLFPSKFFWFHLLQTALSPNKAD